MGIQKGIFFDIFFGQKRDQMVSFLNLYTSTFTQIKVIKVIKWIS
jgi:hypothetical protein